MFCVLDRRGRIFALIPVAAAIIVWLSAPQAVGYIADDGSVFLKRSQGWVELKDWRGKNGLNPLIIGDVIEKSPCSDKGAACACSRSKRGARKSSPRRKRASFLDVLSTPR